MGQLRELVDYGRLGVGREGGPMKSLQKQRWRGLVPLSPTPAPAELPAAPNAVVQAEAAGG